MLWIFEFIPPLGNDKSKVLTLNLRNRLIFRSADEAAAVQAADFLGKKQVVKRSWGSRAGKRTVNYSEAEEHKIKPYKLRKLRDHECVLVHCEKGFRQVTLPPLEASGEVAKWLVSALCRGYTLRPSDNHFGFYRWFASKIQSYRERRILRCS
jgi:hypothetical protein